MISNLKENTYDFENTIYNRLKPNSYYIKLACLLFSIGLLVVCPIAATYIDSWKRLIPDFYQILTMPSPLVTDYFYLGNLASAFLNAGLCGLACTLIMLIKKTDCPPSFLAGYFLVIAHCFYGLNFLNMWPPMLGIYLFCRLNKIHFNENLDMAMFSTAFGPFISEMLFRYHVNEEYIVWKTQVSYLGLFYAIVFSIFLGFAIPAMLPGALRLHKGFNLFNGGLAFGLLGLFIYSYMYKTFGITAPTPLKSLNVTYNAHGNSYGMFVVSFFTIMFCIFLIYGWFLNGKSFKGYGTLLESTGHRVNFFESYGPALVYINIGLYGLMMVTYFLLVITLTDGAGFTGPTTGIILASVTFVSQGQHPKNVWPVLLGYVVLFGFVTLCKGIYGLDVPWTLSTQTYMNGAAFATGLCPIVGCYGKRYGVIAGIMCASMCASTSAIHGGFMLYNGGFTTGITALILIPCLEYYYKKELRNKCQ